MKVEHFEIGSYRGLITGAWQMGQTEIMNLLQKEETAQSVPELIQKAMGQQGQQEEEKGLVPCDT